MKSAMDKFGDLQRAFVTLQGCVASNSEVKGAEATLAKYQRTDGSFAKRVGESDKAQDAATTTAFVLYYVINGRLTSTRYARRQVDVLSSTHTRQAYDFLNAFTKDLLSGKSAVGDLPNSYDTSIQLAGLLRASRSLNVPPKNIAKVRKAVKDLASGLASQSFAVRIDSKDVASPYLTFWSRAVLKETTEYDHSANFPAAARDPLIGDALARTFDWAYHHCTEQLALLNGSEAYLHDTIDHLYSVFVLLQESRTLTSPHLDVCAQSLNAIIGKCMVDGLFAKSRSVFADRENNFSFQCSTAEALAVMSWLLPHSELRSIAPSLLPTWRAIVSAKKHGGWIGDADPMEGQAQVFATVGALASISRAVDLIDDKLAADACEALGVEPYAPNDFLISRARYPDDCSSIVQQEVIQPFSAKPAIPERAARSWILFGPPRTAKTTFARKLAQDLKWPVLLLDASDFFAQGDTNAIKVANELFALLNKLKNVVIVLDEFESLAKERNPATGGPPPYMSQCLTTSLLPKLQKLHDAQRNVLVMITNDLDAVDRAARAPGRVDRVRFIGPPDEDARRSIIDHQVGERTPEAKSLIDGHE